LPPQACVFPGEPYRIGMRAGIRFAAVVSTIGLFEAGCASSFEASTVAGAVKASNAFGFDLYRQARDGRDNFVCSPAGASIALTMAAAGARGDTQKEMLDVLHIDPTNLDQTYTSYAAILAALKAYDGKDDLLLSVADRIWVQKGFKLRKDYLALLRERFRAPLSEVDFVHAPGEATSAINRWASDETHGRIPEILGESSDVTRMVLANAVYLKAKWVRPFEGADTRDDWFTISGGRIQTKTMRQMGGFGFAKVSGAKLLELRYQGAPLSMVIVLPDSTDGLPDIEDRLPGSYAGWIRSLETQLVDVKLPRFKTETSLPLVELLKTLGIRLAFDGCKSNFSGMNDFTLPKKPPGQFRCPDDADGNLYIGNALQKAWIETNELGTEAAAVTVVEMEVVLTSAIDRPEPKPVIFHADHPFLYLIRDTKTGVILFAGRVVAPEESTPTTDRATDSSENQGSGKDAEE
jgi:serpin B